MSHDCHMIRYSSKQVNLYDRTFRPIVDAVLEGYNGIIRIILINFILHILNYYRNDICIWTDGNWKDIHNGRGAVKS